MSIRALSLVAFTLFSSALAFAQPKTVCTITVNSDDEKRAMSQRLPAGEYQFVELLERGRDRWLESACHRGVQCDVLVVSGHFNAGDDFYSDRVDNSAALNMDEIERASCSGSCPGVFAKLKEVYLFGCESLSADATRNAEYGESSRSRMRRVFSGVPVIYGFSSSAPVGPTAAMLLNRSFDNGAGANFAKGRPNGAILHAFGRNSISWASGLPASDPVRRGMCPIFDDRLDAADKLRAVHRLMRDPAADPGALARRVEDLFEATPDEARHSPAFTAAMAEVASDQATATRMLAAARRAPPATRSRVVGAAHRLGWLDAEAERTEHITMISDLLARDAFGFAEVGLVCGLGEGGALEDGLEVVKGSPSRAPPVSRAAALACMGSPEAHTTVIRALASPDVRDVRIAQAYLRSRPVTDPSELRLMAAGVIQMPSSEAQVQALDTLGRLQVPNSILEQLADSFAQAKSRSVQLAIAEVFLRAGYRRPGLAGLLQSHRITVGGRDLVDELIGRLQGAT